MSKCIVPGCNCEAWNRNKRGPKNPFCRKHYYAKKSGRVIASQYKRDIHNFHRKSYCEGPDGTGCPHKFTAYKLGLQVIEHLISLGKYEMHSRSFRDVMRYGVQMLEGDHINGRNIENANHPENIRTVCPLCHKVKSRAENNFTTGWWKRSDIRKD